MSTQTPTTRPTHRTGTRRPWRVHVRDIGPNFSFGTADRADNRAAVLASEFAEVLVYPVGDDFGTRTVYRHDGAVFTQTLTDGVWR